MANISPISHNAIINQAHSIGLILTHHFPAREVLNDGSTYSTVPKEHAEEIADYITLVVADILQAWLDAGSEREVTLEELGPYILNHVKGWSA